MLLGTLFWAFAQQGGSSISLFIDHFVDRRWFGWTVPTALFQSVNACAVMLGGVALAWLASGDGTGDRTLRIWCKFAFGLLLIGVGFTLMALNTRLHGPGSMGLMIAGGGDGLRRTVYRSGGDGADHPAEYPRRHRRADRYLYAGDRLDRQLRRALSLIRPPRITSRGGDAGVWPHFRSDRLGAAGCSLAVIAVLGGWWLLTRRRARTVNA